MAEQHVHGKVALVTGGASGIGRSTALESRDVGKPLKQATAETVVVGL